MCARSAASLLICPASRSLSAQVFEACDAGDYEAAVPLLNKAFQIIDKNTRRNIIQKNTAARRKHRMHMKVKALEDARSGRTPE